MSDLHTKYQQLIDEFAAEQALPEAYGADAERWFLPLAEKLKERISAEKDRTLLLGINGAQGTGKSTLSQLLASVLGAEGLDTVALSIDDFYLPVSERKSLAESVHPLLRSRGVPGTHDTALALATIDKLKSHSGDQEILLPQFDKAEDEPREKSEWIRVNSRPRLIILEGWFIGTQAQSESQIVEPINTLEADRDDDGIWRRYVNKELAGDYQLLFDQLDYLLMLKAPDFEQVYQWRQKQEHKLAEKQRLAGKEGKAIMGEKDLRDFIQHFERLTRHSLETVPKLADCIYLLNKDHRIESYEDSTVKR